MHNEFPEAKPVLNILSDCDSSPHLLAWRVHGLEAQLARLTDVLASKQQKIVELTWLIHEMRRYGGR